MKVLIASWNSTNGISSFSSPFKTPSSGSLGLSCKKETNIFWETYITGKITDTCYQELTIIYFLAEVLGRFKTVSSANGM